MTLSESWLERAAARAARREKPNLRTVIGDRPCAQCGYNLKGLASPGKCPECGTAFRLGAGGDAEEILERPGASVLRALWMGTGGVLWGAALITTGLAMPYVFDLARSLAPAGGSAAWWVVIMVLGVCAAPGAILWLTGTALVTITGDSGEGPRPAGAFTARPAWQIWSVRFAAPAPLLAVVGMVAASWPGLGITDALETPVRLLLLVAGLGVWPLSALLADAARRVDEPGLAERLTLSGWALAASGSGAALGTWPSQWLGFFGTVISAMAWLCSLFMLPAACWLAWNVFKLRAPLAWALGVASALEVSGQGQPPAPAPRTGGQPRR